MFPQIKCIFSSYYLVTMSEVWLDSETGLWNKDSWFSASVSATKDSFPFMGLLDQYFITKDHLVQLIALWASVCRENYVLIKYIPTVGKFIIIISLKTKNNLYCTGRTCLSQLFGPLLSLSNCFWCWTLFLPDLIFQKAFCQWSPGSSFPQGWACPQADSLLCFFPSLSLSVHDSTSHLVYETLTVTLELHYKSSLQI